MCSEVVILYCRLRSGEIGKVRGHRRFSGRDWLRDICLDVAASAPSTPEVFFLDIDKALELS